MLVILSIGKQLLYKMAINNGTGNSRYFSSNFALAEDARKCVNATCTKVRRCQLQMFGLLRIEMPILTICIYFVRVMDRSTCQRQ